MKALFVPDAPAAEPNHMALDRLYYVSNLQISHGENSIFRSLHLVQRAFVFSAAFCREFAVFAGELHVTSCDSIVGAAFANIPLSSILTSPLSGRSESPRRIVSSDPVTALFLLLHGPFTAAVRG